MELAVARAADVENATLNFIDICKLMELESFSSFTEGIMEAQAGMRGGVPPACKDAPFHMPRDASLTKSSLGTAERLLSRISISALRTERPTHYPLCELDPPRPRDGGEPGL